MLKLEGIKEGGNWFSYAEGVEFKIRPLTTAILRDLRKQVSVKRMLPDARTGKFVPTEEVDDDKFNDVVSEYLIEDFKGIGNAEGELLPVTLENKKLILDKIPLRDFIWNAAQSLDIDEAKIKK